MYNASVYRHIFILPPRLPTDDARVASPKDDSIPFPNILHTSERGLYLGMDSDVWKSELSLFVSAKNVNMDIRIRIRF
jgi:hypothetical protein